MGRDMELILNSCIVKGLEIVYNIDRKGGERYANK